MYLGQFAEVSCAAFRDRLKREGLTGLGVAAQETTEGVRHAEKSLSATLRPTLERLGKAEKAALSLSALLPADHMALPWIRAVAAEEFAELGKDADPGYPDPWQRVYYGDSTVCGFFKARQGAMRRVCTDSFKSWSRMRLH